MLLDGVPLCGAGGWDKMDGEVVCRELGYPGLVRISDGSEFGPWETYRNLVYRHAGCNGTEERLEQCQPTIGTCNPQNLASVVCIPGL